MTDIQILERNEELYRTQRGRGCEVCGARVRYTKILPFCEKHWPYNIGPTSGLPASPWDSRYGALLTKLEDFRKQIFRTRSDLAFVAGLDKSHLRRIERCEIRAKKETAEKLARCLGVEAEDLL